jgi:hypothetical protein
MRRAAALALATASCAAPGPRTAPAAPTATSAPSREASASSRVTLEPSGWRVIERESGPVNYYRVVSEGGRSFIRSEYRPPYETTVLGYELDAPTRDKARHLSWKWRARTLPVGGDECVQGRGDSAAVVYVTWRRGLRYYSLKYVWSAVGRKGAVCDQKRNPFVAQDTVVLQTGDAGSWKSESIDLHAEFLRHFADGADTDVPGFLGVGIMSDGDQTGSESSADYADFEISVVPGVAPPPRGG